LYGNLDNIPSDATNLKITLDEQSTFIESDLTVISINGNEIILEIPSLEVRC